MLSLIQIFIELTEKDDKVAEDQDPSNGEVSVDPETVSIDQLEEPLVEESAVDMTTKDRGESGVQDCIYYKYLVIQ